MGRCLPSPPSGAKNSLACAIFWKSSVRSDRSAGSWSPSALKSTGCFSQCSRKNALQLPQPRLYKRPAGLAIPSEVTFSTFPRPFALGEIGKIILSAPQAEKCNKNDQNYSSRCPKLCFLGFWPPQGFGQIRVRYAVFYHIKRDFAPHSGHSVRTQLTKSQNFTRS